MQSAIIGFIKNRIRDKSRRRRYVCLLLCLSMLVASGVIWELRLTGISMTSTDEPTCGLQEHTHTADCYDADGNLICGLQEHVHTAACYSDNTADTETADVWEAALPQNTGVQADDLVSLAKSQLGYSESAKNYRVADDGTLEGYSRYGAWYGNEYGAWNAMFVCFCLHYAGVPESRFPYASGCYAWTAELQDAGLYRDSSYTPVPGDVVFLDADDAGIVTANDGGSLTVVAGDYRNSGSVTEFTADAAGVSGYGVLNADAAETQPGDSTPSSAAADAADTSLSQQSLTASLFTDASLADLSDDETQITVSGQLPEGAAVKAYPIAPEADGYTVYAAYDITVYNADGTVYEPADGTVQVSILSPSIPDTGCSVYYVPESGAPEQMSTDAVDGGVQFEASHFTPYMVASLSLTPTGTAGTFAALQAAAANGGTQTIQLSADITAGSYLSIVSGSDITIDLNGHCLTDAYTGGPLFSVTGGTLTIADSAAGAETTETASGSTYGNAAAASEADGSVTLTYYVTESAVTDSATGATAETLVKHTVTTGGYIKGSGYSNLFSVSGGTLNMESGMLYGGSYSAISMSGGTANLSGGYLCGVDNSYEQNGGAVNMTGGTLHISGSAVLAGNRASGYGGAVYANSTVYSEIDITGGVISGNTAGSDGGGVWTNGTMLVTDGYITNNRSEGGGPYGGGGGIFLAGEAAKYQMTGGYITGNYSHTTGGGIGMQEHDGEQYSQSQVTLTADIMGGFISGNVAYGDEGGGFTVRGFDTCTLTGGHITNNMTQTTQDWGGGGIFISENGTLNVKNVLITGNTSDSFGAGVSACSTGKVYLYVQDGAAVYGNTAGSSNPENGAKNEGYDYTNGNTVFLNSGYQDIFCVHQSAVTGAMLGGGSANWTGSSASCNTAEPTASAVIAATQAVSGGLYDVLTADSLIGLTAHPTDAAKTDAQGAAAVYINGNSSATHGGGIMSNGNLVLGTPADIISPVKLTLNGTKTLTDTAGAAVSQTDRSFDFVVRDADGNQIAAGKSTDGAIAFDPIAYSSAGTYVYYITEKSSSALTALTYDTAQYRLTVTVEKASSGTTLYGETKLYPLNIASVTIEKSADSGASWTAVESLGAQTAADQTVALTAAQSGIAFQNTVTPSTSVSVEKKWTGSTTHPDSVQIQLLADGTACGDPVTLNESNSWFHCWKDLPKYGSDGTTAIQYTVSEAAIRGYSVSIVQGTPPSTTDTATSYSWTEATAFTAGKTYLLLGTNQGDLANVSDSSLSWVTDTSSSAANTPESSEWTAAADGSSFTLTNKATGRILAMYNWVFSTYDANDTTGIHKGLQYTSGSLKSDYGSYYLASDFSETSASSAQKITLYELTAATSSTSTPVSDLHYVVTNTPATDTPTGTTTSLTVQKVWSDGADAHANDSVTVHLLADGAAAGVTATLNAANNWQFTFPDLPYYGSDGTTPVNYTVSEDAAGDYTVTYSEPVITAPTVTATETTVSSFTDGGYYSISAGGYALAVNESGGTYSLVSVPYNGSDTSQLWKAVAGDPPENYTGEPQTGWFYLENVRYPGEWLHFYYVSSSNVSGEKYDLSTQKITTFAISSSNQLYTMHDFISSYNGGWYYKSIIINGTTVSFGFSATKITGTDLTYRTASAANGSIAITVTNTSASYTLPSTGGIGLAPFILSGLAILMIPAAVLTANRRKKRTGGGSS